MWEPILNKKRYAFIFSWLVKRRDDKERKSQRLPEISSELGFIWILGIESGGKTLARCQHRDTQKSRVGCKGKQDQLRKRSVGSEHWKDSIVCVCQKNETSDTMP